MAISATTGSAANSASSVASLALPSFNLTAGQDVYVAVALGSTSSSVTSITDNQIASAPDMAPHNMTGNTSPSPYVTSSSTHYDGWDSFQAFDGVIGGAGTNWLGQGGGADWLEIDLGSATSVLKAYGLTMNTQPEPARAPKNWTLQGSNDGSAWTTLDTQTNQTSWGSGEHRNFTIGSPGSTAYRYFKLNITANNGDGTYTQVDEMYLYTAVPTLPTYSQVAAKNGTGVRVELWKCDAVNGQSSNVITIHISPSTTIAGAAEEYAGVSAEGATGTNSGSDTSPRQLVSTAQGNGWIVAALGFVTGASTTETAQNGTDRQHSIGASAVGVALLDNTQVGDGSLLLMTLLNASENWASAGVELQPGGSAISFVDYAAATAPALQVAKDVRYLKVLESLASYQLPSTYHPVPVAAILQSGVVGTAYSETIAAQGGTSPYTYAVTSGSLPAGTTMSSGGVISGTPTTAATSSFTVTVTDHALITGSQAFEIIVAAPATGGNSGFVG